jgi:hypothetical protein
MRNGPPGATAPPARTSLVPIAAMKEPLPGQPRYAVLGALAILLVVVGILATFGALLAGIMGESGAGFALAFGLGSFILAALIFCLIDIAVNTWRTAELTRLLVQMQNDSQRRK